MRFRIHFLLENPGSAEDRKTGHRGTQLFAGLVGRLGDIGFRRSSLALPFRGSFLACLIHDLRVALAGLIHDFAGLVAGFADLLRSHHASIAAVILEPVVQGAGGMWFYAPGYLARVRELCDELTAVHDVTRSLSRAIARGHSDADLAEVRKRLPPVSHPVVVVHPETGRRALFVNVNSTVRIEGLSEPESDMLLRFLFEHVKSPEFQMRVRWDEHTLVFLDNRCAQHYAVPDYTERRILHRVAVEGARPRGVFDVASDAQPIATEP